MSPTIPADQDNLQRTVLLATDNKNSVLAEVAADNTNPLAYSAYGHQSARHEVNTHLGFNGELHEAQTSWYLLGNGYRAYNPRLMRFHSPDSLSPFGAGGLNAYMYCGGEPVMNKDPTGRVFFAQAFNNVMTTVSNATNNFRVLRASGIGPLDALKGVMRQPLSLSGANPGHAGLVGGMARPAGQIPVNPKGGPISNMNHWDLLEAKSQPGYSGSSTPTSSDSASIWGSSGGGSMWARIAARDQATRNTSSPYSSSPSLKRLQERSDAHPRNTNNITSSSNTSTGAPSSYSSGSHNNPSPPQRIQSSSSPYPTTPPNIDTSNKSVRQKK
ncbi:RHS repeat-associated core domain-containing protein [Pseudomonas sp. IT-P253]|uniref:RHS repeat-associated core domain-containing protein n=1 Tax=Pseudomonas sp. IT-P253 TaxID=3026455 RepID=UPI0039E0CF94